MIKAWTAKGGKILVKSRPVPIKHVIAGPSLSAEDIAKVREYMLELGSTDEGRKKLEPTKWSGFEAYDEAAMLAIGKWLGLLRPRNPYARARPSTGLEAKARPGARPAGRRQHRGCDLPSSRGPRAQIPHEDRHGRRRRDRRPARRTALDRRRGRDLHRPQQESGSRSTPAASGLPERDGRELHAPRFAPIRQRPTPARRTRCC